MQLAQSQQTIAIVIDEYSGTDGLLTKEDIVSEIFGFIKNDTDKAKILMEVNKAEDINEFSISGEARLLDLQEQMHIPLSSEINETLAGWLLEQLDHLPEVGESIEFSGFKFTVEKMKMHKVEKVLVKNLGEGKALQET